MKWLKLLRHFWQKFKRHRHLRHAQAAAPSAVALRGRGRSRLVPLIDGIDFALRQFHRRTDGGVGIAIHLNGLGSDRVEEVSM
jgi:hypothetical protein